MRLQLPTDHPRPATPTFRCASHSFTLPKNLSQSLHQMADREHKSLFDTVLAGFGALLRRYSAQEEFLIGASLPGGDEMATLVVKFDGDPTFRSLLARTPFESAISSGQSDQKPDVIFSPMGALRTPEPRSAISSCRSRVRPRESKLALCIPPNFLNSRRSSGCLDISKR